MMRRSDYGNFNLSSSNEEASPRERLHHSAPQPCKITLSKSTIARLDYFPFEYLSVELQDSVFANLELPDFLAMRATCKAFYDWIHNCYVDLVLDTDRTDKYPSGTCKSEVAVLSRIAEAYRSMYKPTNYLHYAQVGCSGTLSKAALGLLPTSLLELSISHCRIDPALQALPCPNLESLILEGVTIVKFDWISQLTSLKGVTLRRCNISSAALRHLPAHLLYLHLEDTYSVVSLGSIPAGLESLKITFSNHRHVHFSCAGIERCTSLRSFMLNVKGAHCSVDDIDLISQIDSLLTIRFNFEEMLPMHFMELFKAPRNLAELKIQTVKSPKITTEFLNTVISPALMELNLFLNDKSETSTIVGDLMKNRPITNITEASLEAQ